MGSRSLVIGAVLAVLAPAAQAQQQLIVNDPIEAAMIARSDGRDRDPMPLTEERVKVEIDGQHATTTLLQVFHNKTGGQVEGVYRLRPGAGARVEGFAYWNGEDKIIGEVFERSTAKTIYEATVTRRKDPGLLEKEGEGLFSFRIFPIAADEKKRVEIRYSRWLDRQGNIVRYRAPAGSSAEIVVAIESGVKIKEVSSTTHEIAVEKLKSGGARVRATKLKKDVKAGEIALAWEVDEKAWTPSAFIHWDGDNDGYFALALPAPNVSEAVVAKDVTIVIDRSGSMAGTALSNAKAAAVDVVQRLDDDDRVNVIAFSDEVDPLFSVPQKANDENRKQAVAFIERMTDGGGTDIALALKTAFKAQEEGERPRVVIFMTDGQSDPKAAMAEVEKDKRDVRLFTVGLGDGVEKPLLARLSATKRGRFTYIAGADAIKRDVATLYAQISKPLLVGVEVDVDGAQAVRTYPRTLPDLFAQDQLLVTGRLRGKGNITFTVKGTLSGHEVSYSAKAKLDGPVTRGWVGRLWAASRVDHLLEEIALAGGNEEYTEEVIDLAVTYNFVTPYTAFLAIPESELTAAAKNTIESARDRKRKLMAENPDAADLDKERDGTLQQQVTGSTAGLPAKAPPPPRGTSPGPTNAAPPPTTVDRPTRDVRRTKDVAMDKPKADAPRNDTPREAPKDPEPKPQPDFDNFDQDPRGAPPPPDGDSPETEHYYAEAGEEAGGGDDEEDADRHGTQAAPGEVQKKGGCAGCSTGGDAGDLAGGLLLFLALAFVIRRRS